MIADDSSSSDHSPDAAEESRGPLPPRLNLDVIVNPWTRPPRSPDSSDEDFAHSSPTESSSFFEEEFSSSSQPHDDPGDPDADSWVREVEELERAKNVRIDLFEFGDECGRRSRRRWRAFRPRVSRDGSGRAQRRDLTMRTTVEDGGRQLKRKRKRPEEEGESESERMTKTGSDHNFPVLHILTLNCWFDSHYFTERVLAQHKLLTSALPRPAIVGLQEVTPRYAYLLSQNEDIREHFLISDHPGNLQTFDGYGVLLLVSRDLSDAVVGSAQLFPPSRMDRTFVSVELEFLREGERKGEEEEEVVEGETPSSFRMNFGTVHLESLAAADLRRDQLRRISKDVQCLYSNALTMGDFNFDSDRNFHRKRSGPLENDFLTEKTTPTDDEDNDWVNYSDVWSSFRPPEEKGYTFDTETNGMLGWHRHERMRYDRIMVKSDQYEVASVCRVGLKAIDFQEGLLPEDKTPVFLSDHFGVYCRLVLRGHSLQSSEEEESEVRSRLALFGID